MLPNYFFDKKVGNFILIALVFYLLGYLIGIMAFYIFQNSPIVSPISQNGNFVSTKNFFLDFLTILSRNVIVCILLILGGYLIIIPSLILVFNGFLLGYTMTTAFNYVGFLNTLVYSIHNVFELPAIIYSGTLGIRLSYNEIKSIFSISNGNSKKTIPFTKRDLLLILLLLSIGAIIESILLQTIKN